MKIRLIPLVVLLSVSFTFSQDNSFWERTTAASPSDIKSSKQSLPKNLTYSLDLQALNQQLNLAPVRGEFIGISNIVLPFPDGEGSFEQFRIMKAPVLSPELAQKYPEIQSYVGQGVQNPSSVIRFSVSPLGLSGMTLSSTKMAVFIEPYTNDLQGYVVFKKSDNIKIPEYFECEVTEAMNKGMVTVGAAKNADDGILRNYRLAVSATGEYTQYHGGTKALALAAINTTMTRVNGIFEIDFNITMTLIGNTDDVIYTNPGSDPYTTTSNYSSQLQSTLTSVIGEASYDIGHLFASLQNNGNAGCIGCVCVNNQKGRGWTSASIPEGDFFDVDYVAHEMGHQFGANHTWTHGGNEGTNAQMEPGSGSTIMSYAGITGATDVQPNVDPYFHGISIQQITNYIKGTSCQTNTNTGNAVPSVNAGANYTIPRGTPFVLDGTATDADTGDVLTYCWEQFDENNASTTYPNVNNSSGVAFRSFNPSVNSERYFPRLETIKQGGTSWTWEAVPNVGRTLNFRLTVRDNVAGGGTNNSDNMVVTVNGTAGPFVLTSPNSAVNWSAGSTQTVTWNVAGTTANGVNASTVDIFLSTDGGDTYPIAVAAGVANDGSHDILIPNNQSSQCRIMVKGSGNIFFDISNTDFTISGQVPCNASVPTGLSTTSLGSDTATLGWDAVAGATYDLQYREVGAPTWIDVFDVLGVSYQLTGLTPLTQYEAQVRSKCPDTSTSAYSSPINFTTTDVQLNYCASQSSNVNDEFISRVQLNTIDNSSGAAFYSDFTSISTTLTKGSQYTVTVTPTWTGTVYAEGYSVWIDYNRDGDFTDAGEQVFTQSPTTASPVGGNFTVPSAAVENSTRMRVSLKYNGIPSSCESFTYGEVEDYTVIIQAAGPDTQAPTAPTNLTASNTTESSTDLTWTASTDNVGVTDYDVYQDGGLIANVTGTSYQVTGLTESTSYAFYVIANDAAGNSSPQSNTVNETTLAAPTCSDGIQNGDETGVDCGGTSCAPCSTVTLNEGYFETGFDGWTDGGSDCARVLSANSFEGSYSIRLRDNSGTASSMTSPSYDLTNYESVEISFYYYPNSMENGEDFWLQFNDGSGWTTITTYVSGSDFTNGNFFNDTVVVADSQFNFGTGAQFRFRCDASSNNDQV
ncbi:MAG: fibronectin type III domain-containing protein, partial [Bacteroidia bacterium]|nr:fibronectin type III domain-containing protein [Bacteroidia bacterium]